MMMADKGSFIDSVNLRYEDPKCPICNADIGGIINFCESCGVRLPGFLDIEGKLKKRVTTDPEIKDLERKIKEKLAAIYDQVYGDWADGIREKQVEDLEKEISKLKKSGTDQSSEQSFSTFDNPFNKKTDLW